MTKKTEARSTAGAFEIPASGDKAFLVLEGLRQNNLKNLLVRIPHDRITTIVGPSGSGKSSLAFDSLFAEGRWRFIESLSTYTRLFLERMDRPELDAIHNIRPAVAVEQKNPVRGSRSTVGTATEINDYLRLLFARIGSLHCPECGSPVAPDTPASVADTLGAVHEGEKALVGFDLPTDGKKAPELADELLKKGFVRVKLEGRVVNLAEEGITGGLPGHLGVIADRLVIKKAGRTRLVDSLETAFREGGQRAWVELIDAGTVKSFSGALLCKECGATVQRPTPLSLSFNHPVGACPECKGFGNLLNYDPDKILPDKGLSLEEGAVEPWTKPAYRWWYEELERYAPEYGIDLTRPFEALSKREKRLVFEGTKDFDGIDAFFSYLDTRKYKLHIKVFTSRYKGQTPCRACGGTRLKKEALCVTVGGRNIAEASSMTIKEAGRFFSTLKLTRFEKEVSRELMKQLCAKLDFLRQVGLGYITLDRLTRTLSGGEAQRVTLATQIASSLCGVLYILDEPSIGLHPVDIEMLTRQIKKLSEMGNTVVTVEHDPTIIMESDHIIELGPGAGERGGRLVYSGPRDEFLATARTLTSDYLTGRKTIHVPRWRRNGSGRFITLRGATGNNLKGVELKVPLRTITCVTGVSGSGKSTLVVDTLYNAAAAHFRARGGARAEKPLPYSYMDGLGNLCGVRLIDQGPIGKTPRSNPLTYMGGFDYIRRIYAGLGQARASGLVPGSFSFNVPGGRCEECKGEGVKRLEMYFLPDVYIKCDACNGRRFKAQVLDVKYRGKSIYDCLEMTFDDASRFFPHEENLQKRFSVLKEVGLGYLRLGQSATTLSGGEAQRLKIARELAEDGKGDVLYILDEPTTGLHMDDTRRLLSVLGRLVDSGSTVLMIEHNLDCMKTADHIVDLGPGGGAEGGEIVASGTPERVARVRRSRTGKALKAVLA
ncbi:MAG: excinuclease ABC subunit UvrA [Thermodesulfobacteriota bacterium]